MSKLLRADFRRLFKSKFFWASSAVMFLLGLLPIDHWVSNKEAVAAGYSGVMWYLDTEFFNYVIAAFFMITIMAALFVGSEYANGTIRNRIIVGQKRIHIYLSYLTVLVTANVVWSAIYILTALAVGIPLLGMFTCGLATAVAYMLAAFALTVALTAIMLSIVMLCQNRTYSAIICLMLTVVLIISAVIIGSILDSPEYYDDYSITVGGTVVEEQIQNPYYVSGMKRLILEKTMDILPGGQLIQVVGMYITDVWTLAVYDLCILVLTTGIGILFWKRKDLK